MNPRTQHANLFTAAAEPSFVDVPELPYLMVDGAGDPATAPAYPEAVRALYQAAYRIRAGFKAAGTPYPVPPMEGLWDNVGDGTGDRSGWTWTLLLMQPDGVVPDQVPAGEVRLARYGGGRAAQILHIGAYDQETATIARLLDHVRAHGLVATGRHHEIYLSDPRRTPPERRRTILRYEVSAAADRSPRG